MPVQPEILKNQALFDILDFPKDLYA